MRVTHYRHLSPIFIGDKCRRQMSGDTTLTHGSSVCGAHVENGRFFRRSSCWNRFIVAIKEKEKEEKKQNDVGATVDRTQVVEICC